MVDNVTADPGAGGAVFATDDIAGTHWPFAKLAWGPLDTANIVDDAAGKRLPVVVGGTVLVDGSAVTQPVSAVALPLPAGAATAALQLPNSHDVTVDNAAGVAAVNVQDGGNSITIDAASLPLPTGASTAALQLPDGHNVTVDNAAGATAVNVQDGGNSLTIDGTVAVSSLPASTNTIEVVGDVAHDAADAGNPVSIGGVARNANPTAVANGDRASAFMDLKGRLVVRPHHVRGLQASGDIVLTTTTETTIIAATASTFHDITLLLITNSSATAVIVAIRDTTGGTVRLRPAIAANGGVVIAFPSPLEQTTVNTNWTATLSAGVTDVRVTAIAISETA